MLEITGTEKEINAIMATIARSLCDDLCELFLKTSYYRKECSGNCKRCMKKNIKFIYKGEEDENLLD